MSGMGLAAAVAAQHSGGMTPDRLDQRGSVHLHGLLAVGGGCSTRMRVSLMFLLVMSPLWMFLLVASTVLELMFLLVMSPVFTFLTV